MEGEQPVPTVELNFNSFVVKLWRIVNSPRYQSIFWDTAAINVVVVKQMFVSEVLCPEVPHREDTNLFKTKNFESFIRQLNLYGFRKVQRSDCRPYYPEEEGGVHVFHNPSFQKEHPDFLVNIKRLTSSNKAKIAAGLEVKSRPKIRLSLLSTCAAGEKKNLDNQGQETVEPKHCTLQHESPPSNASFSFNQMDQTSVSQTGSLYLGLLPVQSLSTMEEQEYSAFISPRAPYQQVLCATGETDAGPEMDEPKSHILQLENVITDPSFSPPFSSNINFPFNGVDQTPSPSTTGGHSLGLLPIQGQSTIAEAELEYGRLVSPKAQYPPSLCPTVYLQCCTSPTAASSLLYSYYQTPPRQSPIPMHFLSPKRPNQDSSDPTEDEGKADQPVARHFLKKKHPLPTFKCMNLLMQSPVPVNLLSPKKPKPNPGDCKKVKADNMDALLSLVQTQSYEIVPDNQNKERRTLSNQEVAPGKCLLDKKRSRRLGNG
uniref:Heat shock factor protein 5 n=1 Tax=Xenopus tropicalis TaxID=8364 RepID=A0A6I8PV92_XENTR